MVDVTPALRGLAWQYAVDRIDLATFECKIEQVLAHEQRLLEHDEDAPPSGLVAVIRGGKRWPYVPT
jgi:hypothetical protein